MVAENRADAKDYVFKTAKEQDVKFIRMWFTDILGFLKSFAITVQELEKALEQGVFNWKLGGGDSSGANARGNYFRNRGIWKPLFREAFRLVEPFLCDDRHCLNQRLCSPGIDLPYHEDFGTGARSGI